MADGELIFKTALDDSGITSGLKKVKKGAQAMFGVSTKAVTAVTGTMTAGASAGAAAFGALTKTAFDSKASIEQNIGGIETLFKESADVAIANAKRAYKTAGMSADNYMATATSFAASLLQSLGGNTEEAARVADMAIIDMSDNANKMGTSMDMIQNAYQGFAKQNYTMLDNLKLGYGGTKTEMERLLADAQKLTGVKYDINSLNDVYQAIHVIQGELGITGTTAKEAATTIEGSMNSAKAAWENYLAGVGSADEVAEAFGVAAEVAVESLKEIIPRLARTMPKLAGEIGKQIPSFMQVLLPELVKGGTSLISSLIPLLPAMLASLVPPVAESVLNLMEQLAYGIAGFDFAGAASGVVENVAGFIESEGIERLLQVGGKLVGGLAKGAIKSLPQLLKAGGMIASAILEGIGTMCPAIKPVTDALRIMVDNMNIVLGVVVSLTAAFVAYKAVFAINTLIQAYNTATKDMTIVQYAAKAAQDLLNTSFLACPITWIVMAIAALVAAFIYFWNTSDAFRNFWIGLWDNVVSVLTEARDFILGIFDFVIEFVKNNWQSILLFLINPFAGLFSYFYDNNTKFKEFVDTAVLYISELPDKVQKWLLSTIAKAQDFAATMLKKGAAAANNLKNSLIRGVSSLPDKFRSIGANIVSGLWNGISSGWDWLRDKVSGLANSLFEAAKDALDIHSPSKKFEWIAKMCLEGFDGPFEKWNPFGKFYGAMTIGAGKFIPRLYPSIGTGSVTTYNQTINVNKEISTPDDIARALRIESRYGLIGG